MIHRRFYVELGRLLYSISKADGFVQEKERFQLNRLIAEELKIHISNLVNHPAQNDLLLSKLSFNSAQREKLKTTVAIDSFKNFMEKYGNQILTNEKKFAFSAIHKIANAYKGISREEEDILKSVLLENEVQNKTDEK